eukprot:1158843-Pelagomonas_calceolata.AAC.21
MDQVSHKRSTILWGPMYSQSACFKEGGGKRLAVCVCFSTHGDARATPSWLESGACVCACACACMCVRPHASIVCAFLIYACPCVCIAAPALQQPKGTYKGPDFKALLMQQQQRWQQQKSSSSMQELVPCQEHPGLAYQYGAEGLALQQVGVWLVKSTLAWLIAVEQKNNGVCPVESASA